MKALMAKIQDSKSRKGEIVSNRINGIHRSENLRDFQRSFPTEILTVSQAQIPRNPPRVSIQRENQLASMKGASREKTLSKRLACGPEPRIQLVLTPHPTEEHAPAFATTAKSRSTQKVPESPTPSHLRFELLRPILPFPEQSIQSDRDIGITRSKSPDKMSPKRAVACPRPIQQPEKEKDLRATMKPVHKTLKVSISRPHPILSIQRAYPSFDGPHSTGQYPCQPVLDGTTNLRDVPVSQLSGDQGYSFTLKRWREPVHKLQWIAADAAEDVVLAKHLFEKGTNRLFSCRMDRPHETPFTTKNTE